MKDEKKKCPRCHKLINANNKFCDNCGLKIRQKKEEINEPKEVKEEPKEIKIDKCSVIKLGNIRFDKDNKYFTPILCSVITFVFCLIFCTIICKNYTKKGNTNIVTDHKNVTINDTGIAEAVNKVYDSVVIVQTYAKDNLVATGTGFVFKIDDDNGYILTNSHVISDGNKVTVVFTNNEEVEVSVVGNDSYSDIAVLKVSKDKVISVADMGKSDDIKVGDTTFAVGAPIDASTYSWTVTRGILSGKNRIVEAEANSTSAGYIMEVLQTDTAINNGNSGGPLCNANGEVIGITNMKISSNSVEGMGFAIPIETALEYANHFISGDPIVRPYLGISMYDLGNTMFGQTGVYVQAVEKDSPAEKAGLQKGDVITKLNDKEVSSSAYLKYELYKHNIGDEVTVTYKRNGKESTAKITLGSYNITT